MSGLSAPLVGSDADPAEVRRVAEQVLARPEYDDAQLSLLARVQLWLADGLARLIDALGGGGRGMVIGLVILAAAALATVVLVVVLVRRTRRDPTGRGGRPAGLEGRSATDWRARAERLETDGDWAGALRCRYRALLADLVAADVIDEVAGRTARDYQRAIAAAAPDTAPSLRWMTDTFEATWYDRRPVTADDVERMRRVTETVRAAAAP